MQHTKKIIFIASIALVAVVPFLLHAQQEGSGSSPTMTAAAFTPGKGWISSAAGIPGLSKSIYYITSSNVSGSTSWAFGFDNNNSYNMAVSTGNGVWGQSVAVPAALGGHVMYGFLPAYPDTGNPTNGWLQGGSGVSYFNGTSFSPPATFGSSPTALQDYASQGIGWALVNQQGIIGVSTFDTTNAMASSWSPVKALPEPIVQTWSTSFSFPAAATQGMLYILGFQNGQASVMAVDRTNNIHVYPIPNALPPNTQTPSGGLLFAYGTNVEALLFVSQGSEGAQAYSFLSTNGGQSWTNTSNQMPPLLSQETVFGTSFANGVVVIPFLTIGQSNITGRFIDLKHKNPLWLPYPAPSYSNVSIAAHWWQLSPDGSQQCAGFSDNTIGCFNFNQDQWSQQRSQPLPSGQAFNGFTFYLLGNNQVAAFAASLPDVLYYDGNSWAPAQPVTNISSVIGFSTTTVDGTHYSSISPNVLWVYGFSAAQK